MYLLNDLEIIGKIDISALSKHIVSIPQHIWEQDPRRVSNSNFGESFSLHLRLLPFSLDKYFHVYNNVVTYNNHALTTEANKIHKEIEDLFQGYIVKSVIIRLDPGTTVAMHTDGADKIFKEGHRIIIPLITNPSSHAIFEDRTYHLEEGIIYDTNSFIPHSTTNEGSTPRYHLVLDIIYKTNIEHFKNIKIYNEENKDLFFKFVKVVSKSPHNKIQFADWKKIAADQKAAYLKKVINNTC
jgi:hypothetical protein